MKASGVRLIIPNHGAVPLFPGLARQAMFHWSLSHSLNRSLLFVRNIPPVNR